MTLPSLEREFGGPVEVAEGLSGSLRALGHRVAVIGCGDGSLGRGLPILVRYRGTPVPRSVRLLRRRVASADIVHVLGFRDPVGTLAMLGARRAGVPYVLEPSGMHRRRVRGIALKRAFDAALGKRLLAHANLVVATSALERRELVADGVDRMRVAVRFNGLRHTEVGRGAGSSIRDRLDIPPDAPLVLALGRIAQKKGLVDLVAATDLLPDVHLLIAGPDQRDGTSRRILERREALGLARRVHLVLDGLWGEDKAAALAESDCFALPSLTENFGNAAAEAAAAGLPVIVSTQCGVLEILDPGASRVVAPGDPVGLAAAVRELLTPGAREGARRSAASVVSALDWSALGERQLEIYAQAATIG